MSPYFLKHSEESSESSTAAAAATTILCFSHLRWNFVYQRPQHLMSRACAFASVVYLEEPLIDDVEKPVMRVQTEASGVQVLTPLMPCATNRDDFITLQKSLLDDWLEVHPAGNLISWYYTPMALAFSRHLLSQIVIHDCMDQLSAFQGAPPELAGLEAELFERADIVFTGGSSLYAAKRGQHRNVHLFPSSVDKAHFAAARNVQNDTPDQSGIPHPRIGFFGVLDERLDRELVREAAAREPSWHFILIGPVTKIREDELPRAANIHYLGAKEYIELPTYIAGWDVAMMPFSQNESTRFISPTKTPEYLAAGKQVVSTPVRDVVHPYGERGFVRIAGDAEQFCAAIRSCLAGPDPQWLGDVDKFLQQTSWDQTSCDMWKEIKGIQDLKRGKDVDRREEALHV